MPIRPARRSDVPRIAEVLAAGFYDEELTARMCPYREEYAEDYVAAWRRRVWQTWWDYSRIWMVSYEFEEIAVPTAGIGEKGGESKSKEVLIGVAEWQRVGLGWERLWGLAGWWDPRRLMLPLIKLVHRLRNWVIRDQSAARPSDSDTDPLTMTNFEQRMYPFITHHFVEPPYRRNHWSLNTLAVHPAYQNRGAGRELVAWGMERARADGLPAGVIAAKGREMFYRRCGFDLLVGWATEGVDVQGNKNPLGVRGIGGGAIMWTR